ncbi:MAG: ABC transporter ATP-binding protein, partial [Sporomusa sp.]
MKLVAQNLKGYYKQLVLGPFFKLCEAIIELLIPLVMANIIDIGIARGNTDYVWRNSMLMLGLAILGAIFAMICQYYAAVAAGNFGRSLRSQLFRHVFILSNFETDTIGTGGLITRLTNDTLQIQNGVNMGIRLGSRIPFLVIGSIVMAMFLNWRIGLVFLISTPLIMLVLFLIMKYTLPRYVNLQQEQDTLSRLAGENLDGTRVIRAFSRQEEEKRDFESAGNKLSKIMIHVGRISGALNPLTSFIVNMAIVLIVWLGTRFAYEGNAEAGHIVALVSYMNMILLALVIAVNVIILLTRALASAKRVEAVLETEPTIKDGPGASEIDGAPAIDFENVFFAYNQGGDNALANITFTVQSGQTLGIIGGTGSGKSTLAGLIVRFFDPDGGQVLIGGADAKEYALHSLRGKVGFVPQVASLFSGTVRQNLTMSDPDANDERLWEALKTAQAAEFVEKLPQGLDTHVTEMGKNLSGGQRQRLTIARALVGNPKILILDDSASALDYATDAALRKALRSRSESFTTVIIS